jgi:hypothetical protein
VVVVVVVVVVLAVSVMEVPLSPEQAASTRSEAAIGRAR